jgi:CDP-glycerol glycerophosphotransferase (TagB/SpsB family)
MKQFAAIIFCLFIGAAAFGQKAPQQGTPLTYVSPSAKVQKYHTKEELEKMNKLDLTVLYMERVSVITELVPYLALHTKPGATLREMGLPETKPNLEHLEKEVKNKATYLDAVKATLDDIIPYADTKNIVWSILFFESMIKMAEGGEASGQQIPQVVDNK